MSRAISRSSSGRFYSVVSGIFAATAGLFGKVAFNSEFRSNICQTLLRENEFVVLESTLNCQNFYVNGIIQLLLFVILCVVNVLMWIFFNRALQNSSTSIEASVINTAVNFLITAGYGYFLFHESLKLSWWIGTSLVLLGSSLLICSESNLDKEKKNA